MSEEETSHLDEEPEQGKDAARSGQRDPSTPSADGLWKILHDSGQLAEEAPTGEVKQGSGEASSPAGKDAITEEQVTKAPEKDEGSTTAAGSVVEEPIGESWAAALRTRGGAVDTDAEDDFDSAIRSYYRDVDTSVKCRKHPEVLAVDQCPECEAYYCQQCIVIRRGRLLCYDCAEALFVPTPEEVLAAQEMGLDAPSYDITPERPPEFEVGSALLGREGEPSHPMKRLAAYLLDLVFTRMFALGLLLLLYQLPVLSHENQLFQLLDPETGESALGRIAIAFVPFLAPVPLLIYLAVVDFLYFCGTLAFFNRTFGLSWLGCRIVTEWGDFVPIGAVAMRTLVFLILLGWPAILAAWFFPAYRGLHDYAAGTLVINYSGVKRVDAYETMQIRL
ncbi:RDD family protein [bacterium]|nr:RDD family protein [bacterium]